MSDAPLRAGVPAGAAVRVGARGRRLSAAALFGALAAIVTGAAALGAVTDGLDRPVIAIVLAVALVGANLAPLMAITGGRLDALTPVGALLVPIGLLLPLPEAILVYAVGEGLGVIAAHRWDRVVGGPPEDAAIRTTFVIGKSIVGAAVGILAMQQAAGVGSGVPAQILAAFVGVGVSTAMDRTTLAAVTAWVARTDLLVELRRGLGHLSVVALGEVIAGALIAVLATRDPWSLLLGLGVLALLMIAGSAYARAATEREHTRALLRFAGALQEAVTVEEVETTLLATAERSLAGAVVEIVRHPPEGTDRSWLLSGLDHDRWLTASRPVDPRDYEQQPTAIVDAAVSLAQVALTRAAAQEQLVEQGRLRSLVLSTVAHDLRSPLAVASGGLETLREAADRLDEMRRETLMSATVRAVDRMRRLIDDLLGLEGLELLADRTLPGQRSAAVGAVVRGLMAELEPELEAVAIVVDVCDGLAAIDPVSLERIVENLVLNAAKYSPADGVIRIGCHPERDGVVVVVEDQGPGVSEDERGRIFEPFRQGGDRRGGVGLGLYVARRFTELHGGRIWVDDGAGGGAAFHVWLPEVT